MEKNLSKENGFLEGYFKGAVDMLAVENLSEIKNANNFNHIETNNNFSSKEDLLQIWRNVSEIIPSLTVLFSLYMCLLLIQFQEEESIFYLLFFFFLKTFLLCQRS